MFERNVNGAKTPPRRRERRSADLKPAGYLKKKERKFDGLTSLKPTVVRTWKMDPTDLWRTPVGKGRRGWSRSWKSSGPKKDRQKTQEWEERGKNLEFPISNKTTERVPWKKYKANLTDAPLRERHGLRARASRQGRELCPLVPLEAKVVCIKNVN
jgi:hypothetical protein